MKFILPFALLLIFVNNNVAQIVYTDVIPDLSFTMDQIYLLDVDNDTNYDYIIEQTDSTVSGNPLEGVQLRAVGTVNEAVYETSTLTFLKGFALGDLIDFTELWTVPTPSLPAGGVIMIGTSPVSAGDWSDGLDHYGALRFTTGLNQYYGWVRFTVTTDGLGFTIKDYAYHSLPDHPLLAGATVDGVEEQEAGFYMQQQNSSIILTNDLAVDNKIEVYDISGKVIYSTSFNQSTQINLNEYSNGVYLIKCTNSKGVQTFKLGWNN